MDKYKRVVQLMYDVALGDNITDEELESLNAGITNLIDTWYDVNGKASNIACMNDGHVHSEDMTDIYKQGNPKLFK